MKKTTKATAKAVKSPVKAKAAVAKTATADELAFEKLIASSAELKGARRAAGKPRLLKIYLAGIKRGKGGR